jgi:hypothetical protein
VNDLKCLFWNLQKKDLKHQIRLLLDEHKIDIAVFAECQGKKLIDRETYIKDLSEFLSSGTETKYDALINPQGYVKFLMRHGLSFSTNVSIQDKERISALPLHMPSGKTLLLIGAHLPDQRNNKPLEQTIYVTDVRRDIEDLEKYYQTEHTVLVGDLNMNPFDSGVISAGTLHAVMNRKVAAKGKRTHNKKEYRFFYNPMWRYFANSTDEIQGSYYYGQGTSCYFWNIFDQALVRPQLLDHFMDLEVKILSKVGDVSLTTDKGVPKGASKSENFSDHLPIVFSLHSL